MSTAVIKSQGCTIAKGNAASPEVFTTIAEVNTISGPTSDNPEIDVTSLGDTAKAFISGLVDNGEVSLNLGFDPTAATQQALFTDQAAGSTNEANYRLTFTDSPQSTFTFSAWVRNVSVNASVDSAVTLDATLRVTSALTIAWGT
jgi:hypothetical protein